MKRLLLIGTILALPLGLGSCALVNRALQAPARLIQSGVRTITGSVESPEDPARQVALRAPADSVR